MPLARVRQLVTFDRFIARAFRIFRDRCILKGGVVVEFRLAGARTTKDIDVRLSRDMGMDWAASLIDTTETWLSDLDGPQFGFGLAVLRATPAAG